MNKQRIDVPKIKARIKALETLIKTGKQTCKEKQRAFAKASKGLSVYAPGCPVTWRDVPCSCPKAAVEAERREVTALYCLRAHMRGRLHFQKTKNLDSGGSVLSWETWDLAKQEAFCADVMESYLLEEIEQV